jgi:hypothetical protein
MTKNPEPGVFCPACKMKNELGAHECIYCNTVLSSKTSQRTILLRNPGEVTGMLKDPYEDILHAPLPASEPFMDFEIPSKGSSSSTWKTGR